MIDGGRKCVSEGVSEGGRCGASHGSQLSGVDGVEIQLRTKLKHTEQRQCRAL